MNEGVNMPLIKLLGRDLRMNWPALRIGFRKSLVKWQNDLLTDLCKLVVLVICVWGGYLVFLYYAAALWKIFADTPMGNIFVTQVSPDIEVSMISLLSLDLTQLAYTCVRNVVLVTLPMGLLLKFTGLYRLAFQNRGFLGVLFWGAVCSAVAAQVLPIVESFGSLRGNAVIYFLPAICLQAGSFHLSARLIPEFTVVFQLADYFHQRIQIIRIRDYPYDRQEF